MINNMLPSLFLVLVIVYHESVETEEHFREIYNEWRGVFRTRQTYKVEPFGLTVFTKKSIVDFRLGSKYTSVMEEDILK